MARTVQSSTWYLYSENFNAAFFWQQCPEADIPCTGDGEAEPEAGDADATAEGEAGEGEADSEGEAGDGDGDPENEGSQ